MKRRVCLPLILLVSATAVLQAESPKLLFDRTAIPELQKRIQRPELAPVWERILADAEAFCDPQSQRYVDLADPYSLAEKGEHISERRHKAILVHHVGRMLTRRMETLGFAYQLTGKQRPGKHGAALLLATVEEYPVTNPLVAKGFAGGRGDIMRGLAVGYDLLSEQLNDTERRKVAGACAEYLDFFVKEFNDPKSWWYEVHNYNGVNGGAAGCLALAIADVYPDRAEDWVAECVKIVQRWLNAGFDKEGAYLEGVTYSGYGLSNTVMFGFALARSGKGNLLQHPTFRKLPEFYALSLLPGEHVFDARNDSSYSGLNVSALGLASARNCGLYRWLWDNTGTDKSFLRIIWENDVTPVDPATAGVPTAQHFRGRGLCIWRTGWTKDDVMFSIEAGPFYPVTHNQGDKGHFSLYGLGERWAVDPGYANEHEPKGRGQTLGHSCVLVDGKGQALSGAGWGTNGKIVQYENNDQYGYALADCTEAYNRNSREMPGAVVERAKRHAFFVYPHEDAPGYAVVLDDIRKDAEPHDFVWQMMYAKQTSVTLGKGRAVFEPVKISGGGYVDTPIDASADGGTCVLEFEVDESGEYVLWGRVRTEAEQRGKADSFFVLMDNERRIDWHMPGSATWVWGKVASGADQKPVRYNLAAGKHRLVFQKREPGAQLDSVVLLREDDAAPTLPDVSREPLFMEAEAGKLAGTMRSVQPEEERPRLVLHIDGETRPALSTDVFEPKDYHGPAGFPRFRAAVRGVEPRFAAVLLPLPDGMEEPEVEFASMADKRLIRVKWSGHADTFEWNVRNGTARLLK